MHKVFLIAAVSIGLLMACRPAASAPESVPTSAPASSVATPAGQSTSGIRGTVTIGPTCPGPARPDQQCTQPYSATLIVTRQDGTQAGQITSGEDGRFSIDLPPGDYTIAPQVDSQQRLPRAASVEVTVQPGEYAEVSIDFDTGIR
jgi:hypothetical protein